MATAMSAAGLIRNIKQAQVRLSQAKDIAVAKEAKHILDESQKVVPVISGDLKSTGTVTPVQHIDGSTIATIEYGGDKAPYSVIVHERSTGQYPKYLERPLRAESSSSLARMSTTVREKIGA